MLKGFIPRLHAYLSPSTSPHDFLFGSRVLTALGSLTQTVRDDKLEEEVTRIFSRYGTVFVKIRRDGRQMPFAFCQFTVSPDLTLLC